MIEKQSFMCPVRRDWVQYPFSLGHNSAAVDWLERAEEMKESEMGYGFDMVWVTGDEKLQAREQCAALCTTVCKCINE